MRLIIAFFIISFVVLGIGAGLAYYKLSPTNEILMHFDAAGQPDFTGNQRDVLLLLAGGGGLLLVNLFLTWVFYHRERFLSIVIASFTAISSLLLLLATWVIIVNNK